jgi:hypothetical protein
VPEHYLALRQTLGFDEVSLGWRTVTLIPAEELSEAQAGYSGPGWASSWLVIGYEDQLGDPIFVDRAVDSLPVFTAAHGEGEWDPVPIADSFDSFVAGLREVASVSAGREHPVGLETNPLPDAERQRVLLRIQELNPHADLEFWESWFEA